jgi:hypothetical protein
MGYPLWQAVLTAQARLGAMARQKPNPGVFAEYFNNLSTIKYMSKTYGFSRLPEYEGKFSVPMRLIIEKKPYNSLYNNKLLEF